MMNIPAGFARLLANENISVRLDPSAHTATFDPERRVLTMPNWDCSEEMRDMLIGHECAHAIFTGAGDLMPFVARVGPNFQTAKRILNVVEDARIDRLMKRRYPGLVRDYGIGYTEMREKDFFGLQGRSVDSLGLVDRLNLFFKSFDDVVRFNNATESDFAARIALIETFDEAIDMAKEIYDYLGESANPEQNSDGEGGEGVSAPDMSGDDDSEGNDSGSGSGSSDAETGDDDAGNGGTDSSDGEDESDSGSGSSGGGEDESEDSGTGGGAAGEDGEDESEDSGASMEDDTDDGESADSEEVEAKGDSSGPGGSEGAAPSDLPIDIDPVTLDAAADAIARMANTTGGSVKACLMPDTSKIDLDAIVIPWQDVLKTSRPKSTGASKVAKWKKAIKGDLAAIVQDFERKRRAATHARVRVAKTGRIDATKIVNFKVSEDIFLRNAIVDTGKNHGLFIMLDWSGSMSNNIAACIKQVAFLCMFCRQVGIPFRVYTFTNSWGSSNLPGNGRALSGTIESHPDRVDHEMVGTGSLACMELFHDAMSIRDFDRQCAWLISGGRSAHSGMGGTPLDSSIMTGIRLAEDFRAETGVEILNSIWITDGDGDSQFGRDYYQKNDVNVTVKDPLTGVVHSSETATGTNLAFRIFKDRVGGNLIGMFLAGHTYGYNKKGKTGSELNAMFKKDNYVDLDHDGYDVFLIVNPRIAPGMENKVTLTSDSGIDDDALAADLLRLANSRKAARPMINRFTDVIAKELV